MKQWWKHIYTLYTLHVFLYVDNVSNKEKKNYLNMSGFFFLKNFHLIVYMCCYPEPNNLKISSVTG
jgi:hypothetical protein